MFGLGFVEILVIVTVALLVLGPEKLPEFARTVGRFSWQLRRSVDEIKQELSLPSLLDENPFDDFVSQHTPNMQFECGEEPPENQIDSDISQTEVASEEDGEAVSDNSQEQSPKETRDEH